MDYFVFSGRMCGKSSTSRTRRSVGEQHHETVNADAAAGGRGQTVFQSTDVVRIVIHRFVVAVALLVSLSTEAGGLIVRIVELGEPVGGFSAGNVKLKTFGDFRIGVGRAGERRDFNRVVNDEGRFDQLGFGGFFKKRHLQSAQTGVNRDLTAEALKLGADEVRVVEFFIGVVRRELLDGGKRRQAMERLGEIDFMALILQNHRPRRFFGDRAQELFGEVHLIAVRPIRRVELHHREFGVMANRHAFVAEVAVDFKDAFKTADHEALQIEFRRDAQVHIHIERIVVRDKGLCIGAARDRVEHRRSTSRKR